MKEVTITLYNDRDVNDLIHYCSQFDEDVDVCCGRYVMNAKSTLAVLSTLQQEIRVILHSDDINKCRQFDEWMRDRF